ncbi:MAG: hypothetical protein AAFY60_17130 [Myxococcota bacterium]
MNDPALHRAAEFLEPRLKMLVEGQEGELRLRMRRLDGSKSAQFSLLEGETVLTERTQSEGPDGFDALELWLAMKNAWVRSRDIPVAEESTTEAMVRPSAVTNTVAPAPSSDRRRRGFERTVTLSAMTQLQGDSLSALGAGVGFGRGEGLLGVAGELAYQRAPVDDTLTVHHLFVQSHLSFELTEGLALEATGRVTAQFAVAGTQNAATVDLGFGPSAHVWIGEAPELWLRASVLAHPVTQRYVFDEGVREASAVTFSVAAGVGL